ncbi:MAG TPA: head GIN domain-containing protein [Chitinophagaceae bacterium]|nr:head GIN domain-containing protein [Chitinophagaceae bacterium]
MKKLYVLIVTLMACMVIHAQQVNDPNAEVREAKNYHGISVSSAFDVYLTQSNEEAVAVSASETKFRERIKVEVKDGILHVWYDNEGKWNTGNKKLKAYISFRAIDKLTISGACDVFISGTLKADDLTIRLAGASDLKGKLDSKKLTIDLNGASDMTVTGTAGQLSVEASGASDFKGFDFTTDYCDAHASGASDIKITVNKELSAHASGASDVHYKGDAVIRDLKTSGASSVSKRS